MNIVDVIILGAGASGLMCASNIGKKKSVLIIEGNEKVAKKLKISGGGKCNITNISVKLNNFDGDQELLKSVLQKFSKGDLLEFLDRNRVELELRKERYYFCQNSSSEIIDVLTKGAKNAEILLNERTVSVSKEGDIFHIVTDKSSYKSRKLVVATGAKSFSGLGASEIGLEIAEAFSIKTKKFTPALVGLTVQKEQFWMRELSGLSCWVEIKVGDNIVKEDMLFTHKGISGPAVLTASLYWQKGLISINFLPQKNIATLIDGSKKLVSSVLGLPKRLSKTLLQAVCVDDKECKKLSKNDKQMLQAVHNYSFAPAGNFGFNKAEVCRGGVLAQELDYSTLEAKKIKGLYFIGEVVDITGELGGYNFQWAFSSAYVCAKAIK